METWVQLTVTSTAAVLASSGFWAYIQRKDTSKHANTRLLMGLAYDKITNLGLNYIERGWISKDEYEDFRRYLYEPYKDFGGNGVAERIMQEVSNLPLKSHTKYADIVQAKKAHREADDDGGNQGFRIQLGDLK